MRLVGVSSTEDDPVPESQQDANIRGIPSVGEEINPVFAECFHAMAVCCGLEAHIMHSYFDARNLQVPNFSLSFSKIFFLSFDLERIKLQWVI